MKMQAKDSGFAYVMKMQAKDSGFTYVMSMQAVCSVPLIFFTLHARVILL